MPPVGSDHANAVVKFDNTGEAKLFRVQLVRSRAWKIHDFDNGGEEGTLRALFKAGGSTSKKTRADFWGNRLPVVG